MDPLDSGLEGIERAQSDLMNALEGYRELLRERIRSEEGLPKPNHKRIAIYRYAIADVDRALQLVESELTEKILLIINTRFSLRQAELPGGMVKLGVITDETPDEIEQLRKRDAEMSL